MKHKAQEALDTLYDEASCEYEVDENDGELVALDCTNHDKYLNMREPLQQLIDCQLTKEEIGAVLACMSYYHLRNGEQTMTGVKTGFGEPLYNKLLKQKEMVEEKK